ncbi:MAG: ABC transporter permease [Rhizobiales bacterium]|nr:ABC transporter permease [Hyphomicrobiales bacterium]
MDNRSSQVTYITPSRAWYNIGIAELISARDLLMVFTRRTIAVQYRQTILGISWAIINPVVGTVIFTVIFGKLAGLPSNGLPYPLFALSGLVAWQYFSRAVSNGSSSLLSNANIINKVYFPRMVLPISSVLASLVDFAVNLAVLFVFVIIYGRFFNFQIIFLPLFVALLMLLVIGISLLLSALNAVYRDISHIVPFLLQTWMYLTPIIYPVDLVPQAWRWVLYLNPLTMVVQGMRWSVFPDAVQLDWVGFAVSLPIIAILFAAGLAVFRLIEPVVVDRI